MFCNSLIHILLRKVVVVLGKTIPFAAQNHTFRALKPYVLRDKTIPFAALFLLGRRARWPSAADKTAAFASLRASSAWREGPFGAAEEVVGQAVECLPVS